MSYWACAVRREARALASSIVASTCPVVTVSPGCTLTAVTVPDAAKFTGVLCADSALPLPVTVEVTGPRTTATVRTSGGGAGGPLTAWIASQIARARTISRARLSSRVRGRMPR